MRPAGVRNYVMHRRAIVKRFDPLSFGRKLTKRRQANRDAGRLTPKRAAAYVANARRLGTDPVLDMERDGYSAFLAEKYVALFDDDYFRRKEARPPVPVVRLVRRPPPCPPKSA